MLFFSFFKTLVNHEVTVELKNDISIRGTLKSVDQYLNIKLDDISVLEEIKYPHLVEHKREALIWRAIMGHWNRECWRFEANALDKVADVVLMQSSVKNVFIRGSVVRYVHLPAAAVDTPLLEDATRREASQAGAAKAKQG